MRVHIFSENNFRKFNAFIAEFQTDPSLLRTHEYGKGDGYKNSL